MVDSTDTVTFSRSSLSCTSLSYVPILSAGMVNLWVARVAAAQTTGRARWPGKGRERERRY